MSKLSKLVMGLFIVKCRVANLAAFSGDYVDISEPERVARVVAAAGFLSQCMSGPLLYVQRHIS